MEGQRPALTRVAVAGAPAVDFCVDLAVSDALSEALLAVDAIDDPAVRVLLGLVRPGARVLDLGSGPGLFALPAAAAGASVLAVDASRAAGLLRIAARRNDLRNLEVIATATSELADPERDRIGELLQAHGWDGVDVVKLAAGGRELAVIDTMAPLFATGTLPALLVACDAAAMSSHGVSACELRELITAFGYELLVIDPRRPGTLVEVAPDAVQPDRTVWCLAVGERPAWLAEHWVVEAPYGTHEVATRLLDTASEPDPASRLYGAEVLVDGPAWLRTQPLAVPALRALEADVEEAVRAVFGERIERSPAAEHGSTPEPISGEVPGDVVVFADRVSLAAPSPVLDPVPGIEPAPPSGDLVLTDVSFHVRRGQALGIVTDSRETGALLMKAVAGAVRPASGRLELRRRAILLSKIGHTLEPALSVRENLLLLTASLGGHVREVGARAALLADDVGIGTDLERPLGATDAATAVRLALLVAFEHAGGGLLLIDDVPQVLDSDFSRWADRRVSRLRETGTALVAVAGDPAQLPIAVDRLLWLAGGQAAACGHPASVTEAFRRHQLGLPPWPTAAVAQYHQIASVSRR